MFIRLFKPHFQNRALPEVPSPTPFVTTAICAQHVRIFSEHASGVTYSYPEDEVEVLAASLYKDVDERWMWQMNTGRSSHTFRHAALLALAPVDGLTSASLVAKS